jgi:mRNA-degrading endonuclease RelE of RelBE toxin-antitoxin system
MKDAAIKKMMEKQLKNLPPAQREVVMNAVIKNPEFFEKIAKEIEVETKNGASQMSASMKVMRKYQGDLQKIMMGSK